MRGDNVEVREAPHQGPDVVLVHDQKMTERKLCAGRIDGNDAGREFFNGIDDMLAIDGVAGEVKARFFEAALKNNAAGFVVKAAVSVAVERNEAA